MSLEAAFDSLLKENYNAFILTIGSYAVAIFSIPNGDTKYIIHNSQD